MALVLKDRVKETTTTTGTGTYTLAGAVAGFEAFSEIGNSNTTYYCCTDGTDFEVGIGTYTASGTTLARTTILQSSNSDAAVNWTSGTRTIFCTQPAEKAVFLDANGDATIGGGLTVTGGSSGDTLLNFAMDRSWQFQQSGDGSSTRLQLKANVSSKSFDIVNSDGDTNFQFFTSSTAPILTLGSLDAVIKFEGATDDGNETALTVTDPTADRTITLPDATGTVQLTDGSGASLTSLNASQLSSGTVPNARLDQQLQDVAGLAVTNGNFIVGDGSNFVAESGSTARTSLGLGTAAVLDTGISNTNVPKFTSGVADNDFLRVDGTAIEGRSASEVLSDIAAMPLAGGTFTGDVTLQQSDDGSSEDPQLILNRVSSSPADNDILGTILFRGRNDAGEVVNYGKISSQIADASDGTEDGYLRLEAPDAGTLNQTFLRIGGGEVRLFRDTLFIGDNYTVTWDKSEDTLEFADNAKLAFGAGDDISLHWDGTDGHLAVAGTLNIEGSGETLAKFIDDGAVELYHNNSKKLETASGGISVTGEVAATSLDISGDVDVDGTLEADAITLNGTALAASATTDTTNASNIGSGTLPNARLDAQLQDVAGLAVTNGGFIVGDGSNFVLETGSTARTSLGLGSIATQASDNVSITGGSVSGITDLAIADGGTGASSASAARTNLGLGTIATQAADSVNIDGGAIDGITLGTNSAVSELQVDNLNINGNVISSTNTNGAIALNTNGSGTINLNDTVKLGPFTSSAGAVRTITTSGTSDLKLDTNGGTDSGSILIEDAANGNISLTPNGTGSVVIDGLSHPQADGSNGQVLTTNGSGTLSFSTITSGVSNDDATALAIALG